MVFKFYKLMEIELYRADHKGNTTKPELFPSNGLLTKQINHGNPLFYKDYGWLRSIKSHINHDTKLKEIIYNSSSYLSFSISKELVLTTYLIGSKKSHVEKTNCFRDADRFIFKIGFIWDELIQVCPGVSIFEYYCDYEKFSSLLSPMIKQSISCNICYKIKDYKHKLLVIDAVNYLTDNLNKLDGIDVALKNAQRDEEWLLMPLDNMHDGIGFQSRIPVANFLNVEYYKCT